MFTPEETRILHMIAKAIDPDVVPDESTPYEPGRRVLSLILKAIKDSDGGSDDGGSDDGGGSAFAPLIVEGTMEDDGMFTPGLQQPTWNEAKEAFLSGTPVFLKVDSEEGGIFLIDALYPSGVSSGLTLEAMSAGYMWPETTSNSDEGGSEGGGAM